MKIVSISDTHNQLDKISVPDGDILIHAGDATDSGTDKEIAKFNRDISRLPHLTKIFIPGNHDRLFETNEERARSLIPDITYCLIDEFVVINDIKIYGSPWTPLFYNWAFNLRRGEEISQKWNLIPKDTDVLVTHGPPQGIRDMINHSFTLFVENIGCNDLRNAVDNLALKAHIFGHCHVGYGTSTINNTLYINASCCNNHDIPANKPIVFHVEKS